MRCSIQKATINQLNKGFYTAFTAASVAFLFTTGMPTSALASSRLIPDKLTIAVASLPQQLDPRRAADATTLRLMQLIAPGLAELDAAFQPQPLLAESIEQISHSMWEITLPAGLKFSDGSALDAAAVIAFYQSLQDPNFPTPARQEINKIKELKLVRRLTVRFELHKGQKPGSLFTLPLVQVKAPQQPVGAGSHQVASFTQRSELTLTPIIPAAHPALAFQAVRDPLVRMLKLQREEVDLIHGDLPPELVQRSKQQGYTVQSIPSESYTYLGFNCRPSQPTSDVRVRRALRLALDRTALRQALLGPAAVPALSLLQANHPAYWPQPQPVNNAQQASRLLQQAGYSADNPLILTLNTSTDALSLRIGQAVQYAWQQLPELELKLQPQEWSSYFARVRRGDFQINLMTWVGRFDGDIYPLLFKTSQAPPQGLNRGACGDEKSDNLLSAWKTTGEPTLLQQAQQRQYEQVWDLPLWRRNHILIHSSELTQCHLGNEGGYKGVLQCRNSE